MIILNIGAGKISPIPYQDGEIINDSDILVNLDKITSMELLQIKLKKFIIVIIIV